LVKLKPFLFNQENLLSCVKWFSFFISVNHFPSLNFAFSHVLYRSFSPSAVGGHKMLSQKVAVGRLSWRLAVIITVAVADFLYEPNAKNVFN
jgi:hypothetical protein